MGLFGSYARGEAKDNRDVDLYHRRLTSLFRYFAFVNELGNAWNTLLEYIPVLKKSLEEMIWNVKYSVY